MMNISTTLFGEISHTSLFFTAQLRNPWQMLAEPRGSAEPRLKITAVEDQPGRPAQYHGHINRPTQPVCMLFTLAFEANADNKAEV